MQQSIQRQPLPDGFYARRASAAGRSNATRWEVYDHRVADAGPVWVGDIVHFRPEGWEFQPASFLVGQDVIRSAAGPAEAIELARVFADVLERRRHPHPEDRIPYVGEGSDGCRRSAQIDREESHTLDRSDLRRDHLLASAERWERQVEREASDEHFRRLELVTDLVPTEVQHVLVRQIIAGLEVRVDPNHRRVGSNGLPEVKFIGSVTAINEVRRRRDALYV
jgi:hypothetical protein